MKKLIFWIVIFSIIGGVIFLINHKVFQMQYDAPKTVKEQLEFPLSKVTVYMDKKTMHKALDNCSWINSTRGFKLSPVDGNEDIYMLKVNQNQQAERLATIYNDRGFRWDSDSKILILATDAKGVWVPTWILYELISEGCFTGI